MKIWFGKWCTTSGSAALPRLDIMEEQHGRNSFILSTDQLYPSHPGSCACNYRAYLPTLGRPHM